MILYFLETEDRYFACLNIQNADQSTIIGLIQLNMSRHDFARNYILKGEKLIWDKKLHTVTQIIAFFNDPVTYSTSETKV